MKIQIIRGDITTFQGDVLVNAANHQCLGGGGVDGAIHKAAGIQLLHACKDIPVLEDAVGFGPGLSIQQSIRVNTGDFAATPGFKLDVQEVYHTVGPVWTLDSRIAEIQKSYDYASLESQLHSCYSKTLEAALKSGYKSIAFPAVSTGVYNCPMQTCAEIALGALLKYIDAPISVTIYIFPDPKDVFLWKDTLLRLVQTK